MASKSRRTDSGNFGQASINRLKERSSGMTAPDSAPPEITDGGSVPDFSVFSGGSSNPLGDIFLAWQALAANRGLLKRTAFHSLVRSQSDTVRLSSSPDSWMLHSIQHRLPSRFSCCPTKIFVPDLQTMSDCHGLQGLLEMKWRGDDAQYVVVAPQQRFS